MQTMKTREMLLLIIFYYSALFFLIKGSGENEVLTEKNTNRALFFTDYTVNVQVEYWYLLIFI